jgi:hypothetical protein
MNTPPSFKSNGFMTHDSEFDHDNLNDRWRKWFNKNYFKEFVAKFLYSLFNYFLFTLD